VRQSNLYEPQVQRVAEALGRRGFEVEVLCMRENGFPRTRIVNGVRVTGLPASRSRSSKIRHAFDYAWFFVLASATLTARHLRRPYAAVQVYTMPDFLVFAAAIPKLLGSRVVAYMNEPTPELFTTLYGTGRFHRQLEWIEQRVLRFADHAVAVTEDLKRRFVERGARADKITVVLNAADPESTLAGWSPSPPSPANEFVVITHGAIEDRYGYDTIISATKLLRAELPELRVVFTGYGSEADRLVELIHAAGLEDVVRFEGWVSNERLNDLLHTADVGIVAQKASAYSHLVHTYKMMDFWIFGLPVIASRLRAVSRVYGDDVIEYFEADNAEDLARAIRRLHDDQERREQLARQGRLAQERHGWAVQQRVFLSVYETLIAEPERRSRDVNAPIEQS
jgi:glycosyltransferase involved in cell wall biosynthesis